MYTLIDKEGNVATNFDMMVKVGEESYRCLYSSRDSQDNNERGNSTAEFKIPAVMAEEIIKLLETMKRRKAVGDDQVKAYLLKDGGQIFLGKLLTMYTKYLMTATVTESWNNANIIITHKKGDVKDLKNYRPTSFLSVAYEVLQW